MAIIPRIVIVDDIKTNIKLYRLALKGEKYQFFSYTDPEEALMRLDMVQPHLLLLDIEMPKMNGVELLSKIRAKGGYDKVPVIFITTLDEESKLQEAYEAGANDILPKTFKPYQLKFKVKSLLEQYFLKKTLATFGRRMKQKSEENENLIRILCHDLCNPLTILKMLATKSKDEKIMANIEKLIAIIDHVREMMALESGKHSLKCTPISITNVLKESLEMMSSKLQEKDIKYHLSDNFSEHIIVSAEKTSLLNQVFNNLISNGIKFSNAGGNIYFDLKLIDNQVLLSIRDEGMGVPENILPNLFNKYIKTSRLGTNNEKGTGFGLPLVKTYMNLYDGDINVVTKCKEEGHPDDHGTTFTLTFNLVELESEDRPSE